MGVKKSLESIINSTKNIAFKNKKVIAGSAGLAGFAAWNSLVYVVDFYTPSAEWHDILYLFSVVTARQAYHETKKFLSIVESLDDLGLSYKSIKKRSNKPVFEEVKDRHLLQKMRDYPIEHPKTGPLLTGALTTLYLGAGIIKMGWEGLSESIAEDPFVWGSFLTAVAAFGIISNYFLKQSSFFHSSNKGYTKQFINMDLKKSSSFENFSEAYEEFSKNYTSTYISYEYANRCVSEGETDKAFNALIDVIDSDNLKSLVNFQPYHSHNNLLKVLDENYRLVQDDASNFAAYFSQAIILGYIGERDKMIEVMRNFIDVVDEDDSLKKDGNLMYGLFLKKAGETELFHKQLRKILEMNKDNISQIGNYESYMINSTDFSKRTLVLRKSQEEEPLLEEVNYNILLKSRFDKINDDMDLKIIETPELVSHESEYFSATFFQSGKTLTELMKKDFDPDTMKEMSRFLGRILGANNLYYSKEESFYRGALEKRIQEDKAPQLKDTRKRLLDYLPVLFEGFEQYPRVVNIDSHGQNWIIGEVKTKIDNQPREPTLAFFEYSKLSEQGIPWGFDEKTLKVKDEVLYEFYSELNNFHPMVPFDEFRFNKHKADYIKSISFAFFALPDRLKHEDALIYLHNGRASLKEVEKEFVASYQEKAISELETASLELSSFIQNSSM